MLREILTPSDTNNGGGFSVPRFCADSIFPRLNFNANPPMHNISIRDMHETKWEFWHIYRGTPRRHLLMTGWSKFINQKKLCAGKANCPTDGIQILWSDDMLIFSLSGKIQVCWTVGGIFYCSRFHSGKYGGTSFSSHSMEYYFRTRLDVFYIEREDSKKAEHQPYLARASAGESGGMA
ncbi:hypothetical protein AAC387_Pa01g0608 [Persea americana]